MYCICFELYLCPPNKFGWIERNIFSLLKVQPGKLLIFKQQPEQQVINLTAYHTFNLSSITNIKRTMTVGLNTMVISVIVLVLCLQTTAFRMMNHHHAATAWTKAFRMSGEIADKYCEDVTRAVRRPTW